METTRSSGLTAGSFFDVFVRRVKKSDAGTVLPSFGASACHYLAAPRRTLANSGRPGQSGRLRGELTGETIVGLHHRPHVDGDHTTVLHYDRPVDHRVARLLGSTEERGGHRIMQRAGVIHRIQIDAEEVCALAGLQRTNIVAPQHGRATP